MRVSSNKVTAGVRLRLCNEPSATRRLRRAVDCVARRCNLSGEASFELKLAATEAFSNALKGAPKEHAVEVAVTGSDGAVDVEVTDRGRFALQFREADDSGLEAESGRGIPLILALVDRLEFSSAADGTRVRISKHAPRSGEGRAA
jgi:anti-sigma regulatory factor (Ser/Thr protein kinase)